MFTSATIDPTMLNIMICDASALFLCLTPVLVDVLKGLGVVDGEDTEETLSCPHVLIPHGAVLLLTCSVQDV